MQHRQLLVAKLHIVDEKSQTFELKATSVATRTLQYAADIAACRNGQQMSPKALQHRWKREIEMALLQRRAAMTRAVLPDT